MERIRDTQNKIIDSKLKTIEKTLKINTFLFIGSIIFCIFSLFCLSPGTLIWGFNVFMLFKMLKKNKKLKYEILEEKREFLKHFFPEEYKKTERLKKYKKIYDSGKKKKFIKNK